MMTMQQMKGQAVLVAQENKKGKMCYGIFERNIRFAGKY